MELAGIYAGRFTDEREIGKDILERPMFDCSEFW